jgi:hypothetical protein
MTPSSVSVQGFTHKNDMCDTRKLSHRRGAAQAVGSPWDESRKCFGILVDVWGEGGSPLRFPQHIFGMPSTAKGASHRKTQGCFALKSLPRQIAKVAPEWKSTVAHWTAFTRPQSRMAASAHSKKRMRGF